VLRAKELTYRNYFSHYDPITGQPIWETYVDKCGYNFAGENLSEGFNTPEKTNIALMNSPLHKKNILESRFNRAGFGCYQNICVELFTD
jgi:uncharacterized protein YkwD